MKAGRGGKECVGFITSAGKHHARHFYPAKPCCNLKLMPVTFQVKFAALLQILPSLVNPSKVKSSQANGDKVRPFPNLRCGRSLIKLKINKCKGGGPRSTATRSEKNES